MANLSFRKTHHFLMRQWERCVDDYELKSILKHLPQKFENKTHVFVSYEKLKQLNLKYKNKESLVLVVGPHNLLITMFFIDDFYQYIKTTHSIKNTYFFSI